MGAFLTPHPVFAILGHSNRLKFHNRLQGCKVRCASNHLIVSVYRVPQMQGVGRADVLLYFKRPTTKQMRCPVNAYTISIERLPGFFLSIYAGRSATMLVRVCMVSVVRTGLLI